ncbi:hypothetical protein KIN20_005727 [Parelaphostrongylus tenuis]|uniref:Uncharacterized protein n=1 Tax=Parelaphostrongylus tenuis TaxID=148309 RepID=A0AAD5M0K7_PARTN|nr:hypothetical protein KIN20_005727 [Parelaphostrongylus tenuis]
MTRREKRLVLICDKSAALSSFYMQIKLEPPDNGDALHMWVSPEAKDSPFHVYSPSQRHASGTSEQPLINNGKGEVYKCSLFKVISTN